MRGILIVAHGSRAPKTLLTMESIVGMVKDKMPDEIIQISYMEFSEYTITRGLEILAEKGVDEIIVVPYFLFEGIHIKKDIPNEIKIFADSNEHIKISMKDTLGVDERLSDILVERIRA